jgi:recombination protein U
MAKNPGKKFEEDFVKSIPDRCDITRLKDAAGWSNATNVRFTSKNPCDFIVWSEREFGEGEGVVYKLELKSTLGKSLPFGNIKQHQLDSLEDSEMKGVWAGFIVNFRDTSQTFRILASDVSSFMSRTDRKSIPIAWFEENAILIKQSLIRVRWRYDLEWL